MKPKRMSRKHLSHHTKTKSTFTIVFEAYIITKLVIGYESLVAEFRI